MDVPRFPCENAHSIHWIRGSVVLRASMDMEVKGKTPYSDGNRTLGFQPVVSLLIERSQICYSFVLVNILVYFIA
jgi:hypothetical protein